MAEPKTVTLTIEGRQVSVPEGTSLLEAAKTVGVLIPHYCYHPGLPVAGVCRMCLVEVEKAPKLAPACATAVADGQVVHVHNEQSRRARQGVLEMLLINHPLDCPICDQSGECELQDYTFQEGRRDSRYREPKRFNPVEDFGGDVVYVPNRCILCTRCVRFMDDVADDPVLNVSERGDRALIGMFPGKGLTHPWAGNVVDLCPVGALLSKDSLNKARAWELDRTASVCPNCTQGCNMMIETRDEVVVRLRPRSNDEVNAYFMCDYGRLSYRWLNAPGRVERPLVKLTEPAAGGRAAARTSAAPATTSPPPAGALATSDWDGAIAAAAATLRGRRAHVVASPMLSNEALYLLSRLIEKTGGSGAFAVATGDEAPLAGVEDLALRAERAANVRGAELLGFYKTADPLAALRDGDVLVIAAAEVADGSLSQMSRASAIVALSWLPADTLREAAAILPIANMAEEEGTFTNLRGRVQRFRQAKQAPGQVRPSWAVLSDLLAALGDDTDFFTADEVFESLVEHRAAFSGLSYEGLGFKGLPIMNGDLRG